MAHLDRLLIQGIRSFGPDDGDAQRIKFLSPLTLILGQNGCGKTTIIESLKYAVSGDLPPGAKQGQLFVHDPKISRKIEVSHYVLLVPIFSLNSTTTPLQFTGLKGDSLLVTRLMQLTQKAKKLEFKTKDSTLSRMNCDGERVDISGRCIDIDMEVCTALGVSKSILNNVIFCHQEESAWPLDEGKKVKERFDDIFDATKQNKCLEQIRLKKKAITDHLKLLNNDIGHLRNIKDEVGLKRKQLAEANNRMNVNRDQINKYNGKLEPIAERLNTINAREADITKLYTAKEKKKTELEGVRAAQMELEQNIQSKFKGSTTELEAVIKMFHVEMKLKETSYKDVKKKKTELEGVRAAQMELEQNIQSKFKGSTTELEAVIKMFHVEMKLKETSYKDLTAKLSHLENEDKKLQIDITREKVKKGQFQREVEQQQERIDSRNKLLGKLSEDLEISETMSAASSFTQFSGGEVTSVLGQVNRKLKAIEAALEARKGMIENEEQELQNRIDEYREEKVSLEQQISMKAKQMQATKQEIKKIKGEIEEVDLSASKLARIERKLKQAVEDLEQVENSLNMDELKEEIKQAKDKRNRLEDELEEVDKEVKLLQQQSSVQAELDLQRESKAVKESEVRKLKNKNEDTLKHLLKTVPEQGIKYELKFCIDRLTKDIKDMNLNLSIKQRELTALETHRKHQKEALRRREEDLRVKEEMVYEACGNQDYEEVVKRSEEIVQDLQDQKGTLSSSEYLFRRYVQKLQQPQPCCPLCHRGFDLEADVRELVNELNSKVREVPAQLHDNAKKLESEKKKYEKLLELKPSYESIITFRRTEIPTLKTELEETEKKLSDLRIDVEGLESTLMEPQADKVMAEKVQPDIVLLDQHYIELQKLQREIDRLEEKLPAGRSSRSMQQALNEQEQLKSEVSKIRRVIEDSQQKLTRHTERLHELRDEKNRLTEESFKVEGGMRQRNQLEERQSELQEGEAVLNEEMVGLQEKLGESRRNFDTATKEKDITRLKNKEILSKEQNQLSEYQKQIGEIHRHQNSIKDFEQRGIDKMLARVQQSLHDLETIKDTTSKSMQDIKTKIADMHNELANQQMVKRDLEDNLKLRSKEVEADDLKKKIEDLEKSLGDLKYETLLRVKRDLQKEEETLTREVMVVRLQSDRSITQDAIHTLLRLLGIPNRSSFHQFPTECTFSFQDDSELKMVPDVSEFLGDSLDIRNDYSALVEEAAVSDLNCYYQATEWAMLHFHKERMREINTIIRELWRQIYRGNDIDYIEIKTDVPEHSTADKRRNYNYRVVQMKNDVEIDMRGRCSAGQKVLASLIIRMALAETFSSNCGMLALDEPTTNLDRENIESLSTALADIVNTRLTQKNFQLVIITHDEEFLDRLSKVEKLEVFYRVSRNEQGKSVIKKFGISDH
ncbi:DNA repair protein RAD50 [Cryptotermes secundus]|uniref:DNA repair protein RAD50 n=1 Tax=Cryptotermes secundus TaxID=105785 RepID=UPI001454BE56|nr:DNA repair protein RAD50 [Cryptotermes secundus]